MKMDCLQVAKRCLSIATLVVMVGCGGSSPPDESSATGSAAAPTPSVAPSAQTPTPAISAPGGMQLPADATIDLPNDNARQPKSGGFTMPADAGDTQTSRKPPVDSTSLSTAVEFADWETIAEKAASTGKITVVDLWSLSCEPCMKEFPGLVRLQKEHGDKVQCIAVNVDFDGRKSRPPAHYKPAVGSFLASVGAGKFPNYICTTPSDEVFQATDIISIPSVLVYDADGKLIQKFVDAGDTMGFTYEKDVMPMLEKSFH